jgi:glycosyltransferase involved in cell wall biosynthesis/SAM-dependent methyltransferase
MTKQAQVQVALNARGDVEILPVRVTWIANFIPPYAFWMYRKLGEQLRSFQLLLSTGMEKGRTWAPDLSLPNTRIQRTLSWSYRSRHPNGFSETLQSHFPYDTIPLLLQEKPDVVISSELGARTIQAAIYRFLFPGVRLIIRATVSEVSEQGRDRLRIWLRRVLLHQADAVLVNGQSGARYIKRFGVPAEKLFTVPYTTKMTDLVRVPLQRPAEARLRLLYVGQLIERKGLIPFFDTLREWALLHEDRTVSLWIAGTGHLRDQFEGWTFPPNVNVRFLGAIAYSDLPGVFAQSGLLIFPTLADEWGMVVNEAMAAGLPVLGSLYSQAVEELVRDDQNGWCFRPDSPSEMYSALDRALHTSETRMLKMRSDARKTVEHLTPSYAADQVLNAVRFVSQQTTRNRGWGAAQSKIPSQTFLVSGENSSKCPFCGESAGIRFPRNDSFVWRCRGPHCELEFLSPQPSDEQLSAAYTTLYYPDGNSPHGVSFENTPIEVLEQAFEHLATRLGNLKGLRLLDYGCGHGRLCAVAERRGLLVTGVEQSATARREARRAGISVFSTLEELVQSNPEARFDLITLWDVIEHLRAPWCDLRSLREVLKPGGRLLVSTMNTKSLRARLEGPKWENYANPTHTFFFNRNSLGAMISRTGFSATEEWILPIRYPRHGFARRLMHRFLMATSLNSEIVFSGTRSSASDKNSISNSCHVTQNCSN